MGTLLWRVGFPIFISDMPIFNRDEIRKILKNSKLPWVIKASAVRYYIDNSSLDHAIADLGRNKDTILEYWKLAKYMKFFPLLKEIPERDAALRILEANEGNSINLRRAIALAAVRAKSKVLRSEYSPKYKREKN